jgi:uncharacterized membrane protein YbjE (DUF340 family)
MDTTVYLLTLFTFLITGALSAKIFIPPRWSRGVDRALSLCLYLLLFFMGVKTGQIEDIGSKLSTIGLLAFMFAGATALGSAVLVIILNRLFHKRSSSQGMNSGSTLPEDRTSSSVLDLLSHLREPAILLIFVAAGALLSALTPLFTWYDDAVSNTLLYVLLFLVGIQMVQGQSDILRVFKDPVSILLPVATVVGTLSAASLLPLVINVTVSESMAIASGFGWYSLSGVIISELGDPVLGSVAFLSNLFRESIAFLTVPLLAGYNQKRAAISVCGATSMDVTLPIVEKNCGPEFVPLSLAHGIILTLIVPFLVPFFYSFQL